MSSEDETRNGHRNAKRHPRWASQVSFQVAHLKRFSAFSLYKRLFCLIKGLFCVCIVLSHTLSGLNLHARHMVVLIGLSSWLCCVCRLLLTVSTVLLGVSSGLIPQAQHAGVVCRGSPGSLSCDIQGALFRDFSFA